MVLLGQSQLPISLEKLLRNLQEKTPNAAVVTLGEWLEVEELPVTLKSGVTGQLDVPFSYQELLDQLHKAQLFTQKQLAGEAACQLNADQFSNLVGMSQPMQLVRQAMVQVTGRDVNVMITGESGTGKEVVARNLHDFSARVLMVRLYLSIVAQFLLICWKVSCLGMKKVLLPVRFQAEPVDLNWPKAVRCF